MATIIRVGGGGTDIDAYHFPDGYSLHSTALGETFPGFGNNVIPIAMNISSSWTYGYNDGKPVTTGTYGDNKINGKVALNASGYITTTNRVGTCAGGSTAYSVFLPFFFNFDYSAIQTNITSGTITVWLQKD